MRELKKEELLKVEGGSIINSTFISTIIRGAKVFMEAGRSLGSSLRRLLSFCLC